MVAVHGLVATCGSCTATCHDVVAVRGLVATCGSCIYVALSMARHSCTPVIIMILWQHNFYREEGIPSVHGQLQRQG